MYQTIADVYLYHNRHVLLCWYQNLFVLVSKSFCVGVEILREMLVSRYALVDVEMRAGLCRHPSLLVSSFIVVGAKIREVLVSNAVFGGVE